jgi:putative sigma-54 modulation protein
VTERKSAQLEEFHLDITISARHFDITPAIRQHAEEKAAKLPKYYDSIQAIEVILDGTDSKQKRAEIVVNAEHNNRFVAHHSGEDLYGCIDQAFHKMQHQITAHKEQFRNRKHSGA